MKFNFHTNSFEELEINQDKPCIYGSDKSLTWQETYNHVIKLKGAIESLSIPKGHPVIIYGHKEAHYAISILALIHLDIPYIPIDTIYPNERLITIQQSSNSQVVINCTNKTLPLIFAAEINLDCSVNISCTPNYNEDNIFWNANDPLRYIMFTSGSTGEPKGVQITNTCLLSFLDWIHQDYGYSKDDVFLNQSPFTFDVSLYDLLSSFSLGASLFLVSREQAKQDDFIDKIKQYGCTVWTSTPSFVYLYLRELNFNSSELPQLKTFVFAGEELPKRTVKTLFNNFNACRVINAYGPTEATITSTWITLTDEILSTYEILPIGFPKRDSDVMIEPIENDNPIGEIILIGDHVSTGYFKNLEQTKEKFFTIEGKKAYRTGDLGYYKDDMVFFNGRIDNQIKFNGYRIELGEITSVLNDLEIVKLAYTVPLKRGNDVKAIISFVQLVNTNDATANNVKEAIKPKLPAYMIPKNIIAIHEFPVNANHKIDGKQLVENFKKGLYK